MMVVLLVSLGLAGCGGDVVEFASLVQPLPGEDVARACRFDLVLGPATEVQRGVLVLYQRGDTEDLYKDGTLRAAMQSLGYTIVWAHECDARSTGDLQADASEGPARMLFAALDELASSTGHAELRTAGVVLYGFSAAGVLTATMAKVHPERLLGTIQYAAGSAYLDLDTVEVSEAAAAVPTLVLANAEDDKSGTSRSYRYFERGRAAGAPWAYAVQNGTGHCCTLSTRDLVLPWISALAKSSTGTDVAARAAQAGTPSWFVCAPDGVKDSQGETDCRFTAAGLGPETGVAETSGWLPDGATAAAWLAWVTSPGTN